MGRDKSLKRAHLKAPAAVDSRARAPIELIDSHASLSPPLERTQISGRSQSVQLRWSIGANLHSHLCSGAAAGAADTLRSGAHCLPLDRLALCASRRWRLQLKPQEEEEEDDDEEDCSGRRGGLFEARSETKLAARTWADLANLQPPNGGNKAQVWLAGAPTRSCHLWPLCRSSRAFARYRQRGARPELAHVDLGGRVEESFRN